MDFQFWALKWPWHENENVSIKWAYGLLILKNNIKVLDLIIWRSYSTPSDTSKSQFMIITTVEMVFPRIWRLERIPESRGPAHISENLFQLHFERFRIVNWRTFGTSFCDSYRFLTRTSSYCYACEVSEANLDETWYAYVFRHEESFPVVHFCGTLS